MLCREQIGEAIFGYGNGIFIGCSATAQRQPKVCQVTGERPAIGCCCGLIALGEVGIRAMSNLVVDFLKSNGK